MQVRTASQGRALPTAWRLFRDRRLAPPPTLHVRDRRYGSSIRQRSEVGIIVSLDMPTAEHFLVLALPLRIRVASAWSMALDGVHMA